jgi:hypothetical protein
MTDTQLLTLALSVIIPISVMIYSNSRISDVKKNLEDLKGELKNQMDALKKHLDERLDNGFEHMTLLLKLHEAEHHRKP